MAKILRAVGLMLLLAAGSAYAVPVLVTSPGALSANDSVLWSSLGAECATVPSAFATTSTGGRAVSGSLGGNGQLAVVGGSSCSWGPGPGFGAGDFVLWANDPNTGNGTGPLTLAFLHVFGAGLYIQADALGQFTAHIEVFNGASSIGSFNETSDAAGDAIFIGALDTISDITSIVVSLTSCGGVARGCDLGDFAVNSLLLRTTAPAVPEPTSLSLLLLGGVGLALFRRSRRAVVTAKEEETA